jgi:hypothetical protein
MNRRWLHGKAKQVLHVATWYHHSPLGDQGWSLGMRTTPYLVLRRVDSNSLIASRKIGEDADSLPLRDEVLSSQARHQKEVLRRCSR